MLTPERSGRTDELEVLIVDDAVTVRRTVRALLEDVSVGPDRIREATSAREALDALEEAEADLVLLDLVLPDIPGEELGPVLMEKHPDTNLVPLTALDRDDTRVRQLVSMGAFDVIEKPVRRDQLRLLIDSVERERMTLTGSIGE